MSIISPPDEEGSSSSSSSLPLLTVVEYLESSMSENLLGKFPDNSAFDFDYSQSSIWSPLLPRAAPDPSGRGLELSRKLSYDEDGDKLGLLENTKKIARKLTGAVLENVTSCYTVNKKKRKRRSFGFTPVGSARRLSSSSSSPKAWAKVMRAAGKHFKKKKNKNKKKDGNVHDLDLSKYMGIRDARHS